MLLSPPPPSNISFPLIRSLVAGERWSKYLSLCSRPQTEFTLDTFVLVPVSIFLSYVQYIRVLCNLLESAEGLGRALPLIQSEDLFFKVLSIVLVSVPAAAVPRRPCFRSTSSRQGQVVAGQLLMSLALGFLQSVQELGSMLSPSNLLKEPDSCGEPGLAMPMVELQDLVECTLRYL